MNIKDIKEKVKRPLWDLTDEQVLRLVRDYLEYSATTTLPENAYFRECASKYVGGSELSIELLGMSIVLLTELCFRFNNDKTIENLMN